VTQTYVDTSEVQSRLNQLGLDEKKLTEIVRRGYIAFASCTRNDPPFYPGFSAWAVMVRGLREYLLPHWERSDESNYSLVINPAGTVAIAVATGDEMTGLPTGSPATKSAKGASTVEAITSNQAQLDLPYDFPPIAAPADSAESVSPGEQRMTWIFLVHRAQGEVRSELSLPTSMRLDGRVDGWRERIILDPVPTDPALLENGSPESPLPDITIDVKRRA
jgi:hypothetical protein